MRIAVAESQVQFRNPNEAITRRVVKTQQADIT
jgi:hypothetical protein